jgi:hypothetical protein
VLLRIPVRTNRDDRYFTDAHQAIPAHGYTRIFDNMLLGNSRITIRTGVDFFKVKEQLPARQMLIFTGPIDAYYASKGMPKARGARAAAPMRAARRAMRTRLTHALRLCRIIRTPHTPAGVPLAAL